MPTTFTERDEVLRAIERNLGLLPRHVATQRWGTGEVRSRLRGRGDWALALPGVLSLDRGALTPHQRQVAALLYAGPSAQLAAASACRLHHLDGLGEEELVDLLTPATHRPASVSFVRVQTTTRLPRPVLVDAGTAVLRVSPLARAVADCSRQIDGLRAVRALVTQVVQRRRLLVEELEEELLAGPSAGSAHPRRALRDVRAGVRSAPEAEARDLVRSSRLLPEPLCNVTLVDRAGAFVAVPDGLLWSSGTAYEVDSREHHFLSERDWEQTMARRRRMEAFGLRVVSFSPRQLRRDEISLLRHLESVHCEGLRTGPPTGLLVARLADGSRPVGLLAA